MPDEICQLQERAANADSVARREAIRRISAMMPLYQLSRYRPTRPPRQLSIGSRSQLRPALDLPDVAWISARNASRAPGDLEDEAARYHPARHELTINADFRASTDLTAHCAHAIAPSLEHRP